MDLRVEGYLEVVERQLKAIQNSERSDIMNEIRSKIEEKRYFSTDSTEDILGSLGDPHELARWYLGASISRVPGFSLRKLRMLLSFFSSAGSSGMVILPLLSMSSVGFIAAGAITPIVGLMSSGNYLVNSTTLDFTTHFGPLEIHPMLVFPVSLFAGVFLAMSGIALWRLMLQHIKNMQAGMPNVVQKRRV